MQLGAGESVYKWYTEQDPDTDETIIYANFQGFNPNEENVEITVRRRCFMPSKTGVSHITVRGFKIDKAATTWPPAAFQDGMIGPHWSKGWIIEDCEISNSRCAGISWENTMILKTSTTLQISTLKAPPRWNATRSAGVSTTAG